MGLIITCCTILHNMIVEDKWEEHQDAVLNNNYVFQESNGGKDSRLTVYTRMKTRSLSEATTFERCEEGTKTMEGTLS